MRYLFILLLIVSCASAQTTMKFHLHSGNVVQGQSTISEWPFKTKYGSLKIPTSDIRQINLGLHYEGDSKERIVKAHKRLGSEIYKERELASKELLGFGKYAYPLMLGGNQEVTYRAEEIKRRILETDPFIYATQDTIRTLDFEIKGELDLTELHFTHSDFVVPLTVKLSKIAKIHIQQNSNGTYEVPANGQWLNTNIYSENSKFHIVASGKVELWPKVPGQYIAEPKGYNVAGKGGQFLAGALIAKVGEMGESQRIGDGGTFILSGTGNVFLFIVESPWDTVSAGSYRVVIKGD